jgi:hypothetical protein
MLHDREPSRVISAQNVQIRNGASLDRPRLVGTAPRFLAHHPPTELNDSLRDLTADVPESLRDLAGQLLLWLAGHHRISFDLKPGSQSAAHVFSLSAAGNQCQREMRRIAGSAASATRSCRSKRNLARRRSPGQSAAGVAGRPSQACIRRGSRVWGMPLNRLRSQRCGLACTLRRAQDSYRKSGRLPRRAAMLWREAFPWILYWVRGLP